MKLPPNLLGRSPEETIRRLCLGLLREAADAIERIDDPDDAEALHDFRVALRRLRSLMRAYRPFLKGAGTKRLRRKSKRLASSTNVARDTEVQIEWLEREAERLEEPAVSGARYLHGLLESRQRTTPSTETLRRESRQLYRGFEKSFARIPLPSGPEADRTFVNATASVLEEHARALERTLERFQSVEDVDLLHEGRIEAKRLRYVLEPLQNSFEQIRPLIDRMKSLQDVLGELQDTRVLTESISLALETSALEEARKLQEVALGEGVLPDAYPSQNAGLLELLKRQRARRDTCFAQLTAEWLGTNGAEFFRAVYDLAERFALWPKAGPPERRFLLKEVPEPLRSMSPEVVHEGWLPGCAIHEHVRSVQQGRAARFSRILDGEEGSVLEEKLTRPGFEQFWPLTEGRRVESRRYEVADALGAWTVSEFPGKGIVLATTRAPADAPVPAVIEGALLRDVTGVKKYSLVGIAKRRT